MNIRKRDNEQILRGTVMLLLVGAIITGFFLGTTSPEFLENITLMVIAYFFGERNGHKNAEIARTEEEKNLALDALANRVDFEVKQ